MRQSNQPGKVSVHQLGATGRPAVIDPKPRTDVANSPAKATQPADSDRDEFGDLG
jgi:hypothetical protein